MANTNEPRPDGQSSAPKRKKRRKKSSGAGHIFAVIGKVIGTLLLIGITTGAILACFAAVYIQTVIIPKADLNLGDFIVDMSLSSTMYYTDKGSGDLKELRTIYGADGNRVWVSYDDMPKYLIDATIAIEDKRFEDHHGVDWIRTAKGVLTIFTGGDVQGGSTITQQLIKNLTRDKEVTVQRKIMEIFRALEFEKKYSKKQILEAYLNYIYLGEHSNGVYTASYAYFGKDVSKLSLAECASLISITNNPSMYNPYRNEEANANRARLVILSMLEQKKISQAEYDEAKAALDAGLSFVHGSNSDRGETVYSWYEDQVISDVVNDLMDKYDYSKDVALNMIYYGGLTIETCIDMDIQKKVDAVYQNLENLPYTSSSGQQLQSAIVIEDAQGNIVALSGGMGEKSSSRIWSRATDTKRAPGSAFKPLSVYAPAINMGLITPGSVFDDSPYQMAGNSPYPSNSYLSYLGRLTVRDAVKISSNTVAIKTLAMVTPQASFDFLNGKLGFHLVGQREVGGQVKTDIALAPLSMGGLTDGVSVREMATAYAVFPRGGSYLSSRTYTRVLDSKGNVLLDNISDRVPTQAIKETTAWYVNSMLKDVVTGGRVDGVSSTGYEAAVSGMTVAGKTGSTNSNRDRWFVGYTPYYTAAVWCGYDQQERIKASGNPAAQLWQKVMSQVHEGLENKDFPKPDGLTSVTICKESGMLVSDSCKMDPRGAQTVTEYYFPGDAPTQYCTVHNSAAFPDGGLVTICLDDPILSSSGNPTGMYHIAGPNCPEGRKSTICVMDLDRELVGSGYSIADSIYTKSYLLGLGNGAYCTVHNHVLPYDPNSFDINDKATWPTQNQWPGFNPNDESTWPVPEKETAYDPNSFNYLDPSTWPTQEQWPGFNIEDQSTWPSAGSSQPGGGHEQPTHSPSPSPSPSRDPDGPPNEPYIPAA